MTWQPATAERDRCQLQRLKSLEPVGGHQRLEVVEEGEWELGRAGENRNTDRLYNNFVKKEEI